MSYVIANMVGRNEADQYLPQVLERLVNQVDHICFTDDCSDDETAELASSFGASVAKMSSPTFSSDEGLLRQTSWINLESTLKSLGVLESEPNIFVLAIDCDEELYETRYDLHHLASQSVYDVLSIDFYHMWNKTQFRVDKAWAPHGSSRFFRYLPGGSFAERKLACGSEPTYVQELIRSGKMYRNTGLKMKHLSYIKDEDKLAKYKRYAKIDGGAYHANAHIESILDPAPILIDWIFEDDNASA